MRWAVMGAGATGGYFGAMLARNGEEVAFIARGKHLGALRAAGLRLHTPEDDLTLSIQVTDRAAEIGPVDVVLFAVKSYDTVTAAEACRPLVGPATLMIDIQNGVDNEDVLAARYGAECVLGGSTRIEATLPAPGEISRLSQVARLDMGPWTGAVTEQQQRLHGIMCDCGIDAHLDADVRRIKWEKFLFICPAAMVTSVTRATVGEVAAVPETLALFRAATEEVAFVAEAAGIDLGGEAAVERTVAMIKSLPPTMKTSMQRDLESGRRLEIDAFSGAVRRIGAAHGVPTPTHDILYAALKPAALAANHGVSSGP